MSPEPVLAQVEVVSTVLNVEILQYPEKILWLRQRQAEQTAIR